MAWPAADWPARSRTSRVTMSACGWFPAATTTPSTSPKAPMAACIRCWPGTAGGPRRGCRPARSRSAPMRAPTAPTAVAPDPMPSSRRGPMPGIVPKASIVEMIAPKPALTAAPSGRIARLHLNEGALGPSPKAVEAMRAAAVTMHRYPGVDASGLATTLGSKHGIVPERIVLGCGSDELIKVLCLAFLEPGDEALHTR